uniref:Putative secreted peptide n=1 Tax=Anopheles braziliensis TaxID=58242 RepID=A0A2M3ZP83_9DIPT
MLRWLEYFFSTLISSLISSSSSSVTSITLMAASCPVFVWRPLYTCPYVPFPTTSISSKIPAGSFSAFRSISSSEQFTDGGNIWCAILEGAPLLHTRGLSGDE